MKGLRSFLSAAVMVLLAAGCAQEIEEVQVIGDTSVSLTAKIEDASTKTVLDYDRKLTMWNGFETISVLNGQGNYYFQAYSEEPAAVVTFTLLEGQTYEPSDAVAMYPFSDQYTLDKETMTVTDVSIGKTSPGIPGGYLLPVMMAYATGNELNFKNATSLLRFKVKDPDVWEVTVSANGGENMSGVYDLQWNDGSPRFIPSADGKQYDYVSVWPSALGTGVFQAVFVAGEYYYINVVPGTFSQGFTVTLNGVECKVTGEEKTLERNTIYDLGELALPQAQSWGIAGTMNNWGESGDYILVEEGDWMVYRGLPVSFMDRFQFRADASWGRQIGFAGPIESGVVNQVNHSDRGDIYVFESGIYDVYLAKDLLSFKVEKVGDIEGKPEVRNWGLVGTMNDWGNSGVQDFVMTLEGNLYVVRDVTIRISDAFKFRVNNNWVEGDLGQTRPAEGMELYPVRNLYPYNLVVGGADITVEESGIYDVYLSCYEDGFRVVKTGYAEDVDPDPTPDPEPAVQGWGIVGTFNNWANDVMMTSDGTYYVAKGLSLEGELKFRKDASWTVNYGLLEGVAFVADAPVDLMQGGPNINVEPGVYDVYLDEVNALAWFITDGSYPGGGTVPEEPEVPAQAWYLVGAFNGWDPADPAYVMTKTGDWYVFEAMTFAEDTEVKFAAGGWGVNRGGDWVGENQALSLAQDAPNIQVPAGTYDIYLSATDDMSTAYFCTPGTRP